MKNTIFCFLDSIYLKRLGENLYKNATNINYDDPWYLQFIISPLLKPDFESGQLGKMIR